MQMQIRTRFDGRISAFSRTPSQYLSKAPRQLARGRCERMDGREGPPGGGGVTWEGRTRRRRGGGRDESKGGIASRRAFPGRQSERREGHATAVVAPNKLFDPAGASIGAFCISISVCAVCCSLVAT